MKKLDLLVIFSVLLLAVVPLAKVPSLFYTYACLYCFYLAMANMWNLVAGYAGLISLCPAAFVGLGGYTVILGTWFSLPWYLGLVLGGVVAALFAVLVSLPLFRLRGVYFTIGSFVVPEILKGIFLIWRPVGGTVYGRGAGYPIQGDALGQLTIYYLALGLAFLSLALVRRLSESPFGMAMRAIRDNESAAERCGVDTFKVKFEAFCISALVTGWAGGIYYLGQGYIEPLSGFGIQWLIAIMLSVIIGGRGTIGGPILGVGLFLFLYFLLTRYGELSLILQGSLLITIAIVVPQGLVGMVRKIKALLERRIAIYEIAQPKS